MLLAAPLNPGAGVRAAGAALRLVFSKVSRCSAPWLPLKGPGSSLTGADARQEALLPLLHLRGPAQGAPGSGALGTARGHCGAITPFGQRQGALRSEATSHLTPHTVSSLSLSRVRVFFFFFFPNRQSWGSGEGDSCFTLRGRGCTHALTPPFLRGIAQPHLVPVT